MKQRHNRQSFLGSSCEVTFSSCRVGLIGLGGGGSHLAQQLAHLGVRNFLLVDPDEVEESNLNRLVGATANDAANGVPKTHVSERLIKGINPDSCVESIAQKWQECHQLLRGCHILFGCLDLYRDRYELEITARRYLIPYIDIGMDVHRSANEFSVSGQVILSMPGTLCLRCLGFLRDELLAKEAANYGAAGGRPQVVWANGVLASMAVGLFTQLLTPWHSDHQTTVYLEYNGNSGTVSSSSRLEYMKGRDCAHFSALHDLGDPFWIPEPID